MAVAALALERVPLLESREIRVFRKTGLSRSSRPCCFTRDHPSLSSHFLFSHLQVRNSNFSMECSDTHNNSNSHPAASNGQCTQTAVRAAAIFHSPYIYSIIVSCSEYLCQDTLVCVTKPIDCPCPNVEDIKCVVPDAQDAGSGTRLCIRGGTDCTQLEKLVKKFSQ
jgi:hypothetical protein